MGKNSVKNTSAQIRAETGTRLVALFLVALLLTAPIQVQAYWRWNYGKRKRKKHECADTR